MITRGAVEREVALDPGLAVAGRVVAAESGRPLEGVRVGSYWALPGVHAVTDAQGAFRITGLWPGKWTFHTRAKGRSDWSAEVFVAVDRTPEDLLISIPVGREISGIVVDQDGRPLAGVTVEAGADPVETQADGRFVVDHEFEVDADSSQIKAGVRATREGFTPAFQEVEFMDLVDPVEPGVRDVTVRLVPADVTDLRPRAGRRGPSRRGRPRDLPGGPARPRDRHGCGRPVRLRAESPRGRVPPLGLGARLSREGARPPAARRIHRGRDDDHAR